MQNLEFLYNVQIWRKYYENSITWNKCENVCSEYLGMDIMLAFVWKTFYSPAGETSYLSSSWTHGRPPTSTSPSLRCTNARPLLAAPGDGATATVRFTNVEHLPTTPKDVAIEGHEHAALLTAPKVLSFTRTQKERRGFRGEKTTRDCRMKAYGPGAAPSYYLYPFSNGSHPARLSGG